jgi:hypothetical protein
MELVENPASCYPAAFQKSSLEIRDMCRPIEREELHPLSSGALVGLAATNLLFRNVNQGEVLNNMVSGRPSPNVDLSNQTTSSPFKPIASVPLIYIFS